MKTQLSALFAGLCLTVGLVACDDELVKSDYDRLPSGQLLPEVVTGGVTMNFGTSAILQLTATAQEGMPIKDCGILVSTDTLPSLTAATTLRCKAAELSDEGQASIDATGLSDSTTYYYRAYAYTDNGIAYGETRSFYTNSSGIERLPDYILDTADRTMAAADDFQTPQLEGSEGDPFTPCNLAILGQRSLWGWVSTTFDVNLLFNQGNGYLAGDVDNLLVLTADLSGRYFPQLQLTAFNLASAFGPDYADLAGNFEVYVQPASDEEAADLSAATLIGTGEFPTDPNDPEQGFKSFTFEIPSSFNGLTHIIVRNQSWMGDTDGNLGLVIVDYQLSSLYRTE